MRREERDGIQLLWSDLLESAGFAAVFSERTGGHSGGAFASLNLGAAIGDDRGAVLANRRRLAAALGIETFTLARQVHGAMALAVSREAAGAGFGDPATVLGPADALTTTAGGVAISVLTADCVPVVLADPAGGLLAVVHAGWRGLAAGVVEAGLARFDPGATVVAAIGPAIGADHYEVGDEVARAVAARAGPDVVARPSPLDRPHLDLPGAVVRILQKAGVAGIDAAGECTACFPQRYFSHRRDGVTGRQAAVAFRP